MHSKQWQAPGAAGGGEARSAFEEDAVFPTGGTAGDMSRRSRFAWALTGSGHYLVECIELALRLPAIDLFLSAAAEEVLPLYDYRIAELRTRCRVFRDKTASSVPVGMLYDDVYHTVIIAPAPTTAIVPLTKVRRSKPPPPETGSCATRNTLGDSSPAFFSSMSASSKSILARTASDRRINHGKKHMPRFPPNAISI